jgi:3-isopropylmalate/(R)-2-methylmalate dehydratase small subunit
MQPFTVLTGVAVPLDEANMDTNQLCPTRFNKYQPGPHFAKILLHDRRFNADGSEKPDYILNQEPYRQAKIVISGRNFGSGSSRETAVFGLDAFGIRCVVAPSFGDIFANNCFKNGVLPAVLPQEDVTRIMSQLLGNHPGAEMTVDLPNQTITGPDGTVYRFTIESLRKRRLLRALDDISLTREFQDEIAAFEAKHRADLAWLPV